MKAISILPLNNYIFKYIGSGIAALSLLFITIKGNYVPFQLMLWLFNFGLAIMIFSKEKNETSRVQKIRYTSFKAGFLLFISIILGLEMTRYMNPAMGAPNYLIIPAFCQIFYNVLYYSLLVIAHQDENNEESISTNFKNYPVFYLVYSIALTMILMWMLVLK